MLLVCSSISTASAASSGFSGSKYRMRRNRNNMRSANRLVIFLAFLGADDTAGGFFQFSVHESGTNSTDMLISDSSLGIDEEAFRNAPDAVVHGDLSGFIPTVGIKPERSPWTTASGAFLKASSSIPRDESLISMSVEFVPLS